VKVESKKFFLICSHCNEISYDDEIEIEITAENSICHDILGVVKIRCTMCGAEEELTSNSREDDRQYYKEQGREYPH
jgi:hypothetical protein